MGSLHINTQLMMDFFKESFLVLRISYYTLMTFLMMLSAILLSMLMMLFSILSVIRYLICGKNLTWFLNLNLICKTLLTGARSSLLISMLGKFNGFRLTRLITLVLLMWKWMGLFLRSIVKNEPVLFQNDVALYFEPYWKQENVAVMKFLVLH